jgi:hypothetical protein
VPVLPPISSFWTHSSAAGGRVKIIDMQKGRGGMGSHKHGISGRSGKGPATRLYLNMMARRDLRKSKLKPLRFSSVSEALEKNRLKK